MEEFGIDLDEVFRVIDNAEVLVVRFALVDDRLLLDAREDGTGAVLKVVPKAGSVEERFRTIKELRPGLPLPERIMSFQWPRGLQSFRAAGIWGRLERRCAAVASGDPGLMCDAAWKRLEGAERELVRGAIRGGEGFQTLWPRG
ncbi:MAG: hypothetical protein GEU28_03855 [Dehalococcoidia bacterium]|nr:hypothetical protein [Dehalococcoidia bacterium]